MRIVDGGRRIAMGGSAAPRAMPTNAAPRDLTSSDGTLDPANKNAGRLVAIRHFDCRSAAKTELCVTVSEFFKPWFLSIPRA